MSYSNARHESRLIIIEVLQDAFAQVSTRETEQDMLRVILDGQNEGRTYYYRQESFVSAQDRDLHNFPFLFLKDGSPWVEANSYILNFIARNSSIRRPTDNARRRASKLLDYILFCEDNEISWLDFTGARPISRPTYRYFDYLKKQGARDPAVINQYTGVVYDFYKFVAENWHDIDLDRVDKVKSVQWYSAGDYGGRVITKQKRSQTQAPRPTGPVAIGYVRDEGEDLRPLANSELGSLLQLINGDSWSVPERLMIYLSVMTGARKQSILTLRLKHLKLFDEARLERGSYSVYAGPGTGIDTKNNVRQKLYIPQQLAVDLKVYANSPIANQRRSKFKQKFLDQYHGLPPLKDDDEYIFLSNQGDCYYMSVDDPRYLIRKSPPKGQVTDQIKRKIFAALGAGFPKDFTFHWLRATFAFQLYQVLLPLISSGKIMHGEEISFIQKRMHHAKRETTENYLKLFRMDYEKLTAQEMYETYLLGFARYEDLRLIDERNQIQ